MKRGGRKPGHLIGGRAHRYRAQSVKIPGPKRCELCGSRNRVVRDHRDGNEYNDRPGNIRWLCWSCNMRRGHEHSKRGGKPVNIWNPDMAKNVEGAKTLGAYVAAIMKHSPGAHDEGGAILHATPAHKRSEFAREIWALRREHGTDKFTDFDWDAGEKVRLNGAKKNPIALLSPALLDAITTGAGFAAGTGIYDAVSKRVKKNRGRNPGATVEEAEQLAQEFHGRPPREIVEAQESHMDDGAYTVLGTALELWIIPVQGDPNDWPEPQIVFDDQEVRLVADPRSSRKLAQFYFVGGDQSVSDAWLREEGIPTDTELVPLGLLYGINYWDDKSFDTGEFGHRFGEETGEVPALYYDRKKQKLYFVGGAYGIAPVRGDINASPGIVN